MAVDFPSDLIADVARAADSQALQQARAKLAGGAPPAGVAASAFAGELAATEHGPAPPAAERSGEKALERFEAMMLQQMLQQMMPKEAGAVYGEGFAGDMWRSMQAEKLAESFAERGGIGIAKTLASRLAVDGHDLRASTASGAAIVDRITLQMLREQQES